MRSRRTRTGLTLLELLAASALFAGLCVLVFGTVWSFLHVRDGIERLALPFSTGPVVMQRIVDDLQCADLSDIKDSDGFEASAETQGSEDVTKIDFVAAVPSRDRVKVGDEWVRAAVNEIGYRLRRSEVADGLLALYRREDYGVDDDPKAGGKYYKIADRVKRFAIDFYDEDPGEPTGDGAEGDTDWDAKSERKLPWGCRVTLVLSSPGSVDDQGEEVEEQRNFVFQTYVPFRTRFDKPEGGAKPGTNNPGTNNPGNNNPGTNNPGGG